MRLPLVTLSADGRVEDISVLASELEHVAFFPGVMLASLPSDFSYFMSHSRSEFISQFRSYPVALGAGNVSILAGGDVNTLMGLFRVVFRG